MLRATLPFARWLLVCAALLPSEVPAEPQRFELRALGVLGGDDDSNLSSYLLGRAGEAPQLLIDGGSLVEGIARSSFVGPAGLAGRESPTARAQAVTATLRTVQAVLLTHAHLDHVVGLLTLLPRLAAPPPHTPLALIALPPTLEALREHLFSSSIWLDPTRFPAGRPLFQPTPLVAGESHVVAAGAFTVEAVELRHPVPSAAFFVRAGEAVYLHLGDTGPTEAVWSRARPLFQAGELRALAIEVSFSSDQEELAIATGHLTPRLLLVELNKLAQVAPAATAKLTSGEARRLAAELAPAFRRCPIVAIHIKGGEYERVAQELDEFRRAGLNIIRPQQGMRYAF